MANIITDLSVNNKWYLRQSNDNAFSITFVDSLGAAFDLTGYVFTLKLARKSEKGDPVLTLTEGNGITNGGATGIVDFAITDVQSAALFNDYYYEIQATLPSGLIHVLFQGKAIVNDLEYKGSGFSNVTATVNLSGSNITATISLPAGGGDLLAANNLSDLDSATTARTNLDVYSKTESDNFQLLKLNTGANTGLSSSFKVLLYVDETGEIKTLDELVFNPITGEIVFTSDSTSGDVSPLEIVDINGDLIVRFSSDKSMEIGGQAQIEVTEGTANSNAFIKFLPNLSNAYIFKDTNEKVYLRFTSTTDGEGLSTEVKKLHKITGIQNDTIEDQVSLDLSSTVASTDYTLKTISTDTDTTHYIEIIGLALKDKGTNDSTGGKVVAVYKNDSGTVSLVHSDSNQSSDETGASFNIAISGTDLIIQFTSGNAGTQGYYIEADIKTKYINKQQA